MNIPYNEMYNHEEIKLWMLSLNRKQKKELPAFIYHSTSGSTKPHEESHATV